MKIEDCINKIIQGSALDILKTLPDESIDCVITSPPYWGLRSYKTTPQIWDSDINCQHEWQEEQGKSMSGGSNGLAPEYNENRKFSSATNLQGRNG
jgi:DNA modification methylase